MSETEPQPAVQPRRRFQFSLRTLFLLFVVLGSSLAVFGAWGILVFGLVVVLAIYVHRVASLPFAVYLVLGVLCLVSVPSLMFSVAARRISRRVKCQNGLWENNLHQIADALKQYHRANGCFPPACLVDKNGKPMHSWRVLILPHLGESPLYKASDFSEPWDGPKNKNLSATQQPLGFSPRDLSYVAVVGASAAWTGEKSRKLTDFGTDLSKTVMFIEVANSGIGWAEPKDLSLDAITPADGKSSTLALIDIRRRQEEFFFTYDCCVNVATADGGQHCLRLDNRSAEDLRKLLQVGGFREDKIGAPVRRLNWSNIAALAVWLASVGMLLTRAVRGREVLSVPPPPAC